MGTRENGNTPHGAEEVETAPFRFLDLPPEIWSRICKDVAQSDGGPIDLDCALGRDADVKLQQAVCQPAITRVCKAIRDETLPTFYRSLSSAANLRYRFRFELLCEWLVAIGTENSNYLQNIIFKTKIDFGRDQAQKIVEVCNSKIHRDQVPLAIHMVEQGLVGQDKCKILLCTKENPIEKQAQDP